MRIVKIAPDGRCMFRALASGMSYNQVCRHICMCGTSKAAMSCAGLPAGIMETRQSLTDRTKLAEC